eukprot:TRINITY_DN7242_c1_g1_i1.p1 TRINITY_DN7242_c1_g1~~TRINITY_DN7242_c1_g1_i1.p1  ORF type:complete len:294 (+),score=56.36 TRINITY_DN7242_c1_g1_i1:59-883(+)
MQAPLMADPVKPAAPMPGGMRRKLMIEHKPKFLCYCYGTEVKADGWNGPQVLKIERTLMDCLLAPCCGNRVTVSGSTAGKIQYSFYHGGFSSSFLSSSHGGAVESMSINSMTNPILYTLNVAYASLCGTWNFYTQPSNVDFFVANGIDGSEAMGIHAEHEYIPLKSCCLCHKNPHGCCDILKLMCCPVSDYKTTAVQGPRLAGAPLVGTLASGSDGGWFCPHYGGVADIPAESSPEQMVQWTMLWGETMSNSGITRLKKNWKGQTKIKTIQQMA